MKTTDLLHSWLNDKTYKNQMMNRPPRARRWKIALSVINETFSKKTILIMIAVGLSFFLPNSASAVCYTGGIGGRLTNYCALDKIQGARVDLRTVQFIDYKFKREGKRRGLGLPTRLAANTTSKSAYPILSYSDNINGGNSPEPLVLGNLSFDGEQELYRREGIVAGLGIGFNGRYIHGEGQYLNYGVNASYAHSPKYGLGITTSSAKLSSINHIRNWWFLDAHINTSRIRRDITDDTNNNFSIVTSKVFEPYDSIYSEASFGVNRYFAESYNQNQVLFSYKTIHANGVYSAFNLTVGDAVENQLVTKFALSGQIVTQLANKRLKLSASYSQADGGILLGFERRDETYSISASYPLWRGLTASVGYRTTDSTIDYFDMRTPTFDIQFSNYNF
ncbi:MAG: hypothetical protein HOJ88_11710 [Proteobacteria bacterium]|nr:hypothetical protein [Pseudomonadota bacterium]